MRRIGMLCCALVLCVSIPMTIIRSSDTKEKPQTPAVERLPPVAPTVVHPEKETPFRVPHWIVPDKEPHKDLTARR